MASRGLIRAHQTDLVGLPAGLGLAQDRWPHSIGSSGWRTEERKRRKWCEVKLWWHGWYRRMSSSGAERCACMYATLVVKYSILLRLSRSRCTAIIVHVINYWVSHTLINVFALIHMLATGSRRQHQLQKYNIRQYMSRWGQTSAVSPSELLVMSQWTCQMYSGCFYTNIKLCPFCPQLADPTISCSLIHHNFYQSLFSVLNLIMNLITSKIFWGILTREFDPWSSECSSIVYDLKLIWKPKCQYALSNPGVCR